MLSRHRYGHPALHLTHGACTGRVHTSEQPPLPPEALGPLLPTDPQAQVRPSETPQCVLPHEWGCPPGQTAQLSTDAHSTRTGSRVLCGPGGSTRLLGREREWKDSGRPWSRSATGGSSLGTRHRWDMGVSGGLAVATRHQTIPASWPCISPGATAFFATSQGHP